MKVTYTTANGQLVFELDATTPKAAFEAVAAIQELFEEERCGCCQSTRIRCEVREYDKNKYFKMICSACGATLDFGQNKDMVNIFPKRVDKENVRMSNNGWYVYRRENENEERPQLSMPAPAHTQGADPVNSTAAFHELLKAKGKNWIDALQWLSEHTKTRYDPDKTLWSAVPIDHRKLLVNVLVHDLKQTA